MTYELATVEDVRRMDVVLARMRKQDAAREVQRIQESIKDHECMLRTKGLDAATVRGLNATIQQLVDDLCSTILR